jgi:hypothetical protein
LKARNYPAPPAERDYWRKTIREALQKGYVRRGKGPYATKTFIIPKKNGKLRPIMDYRPLNEHTIKNKYPLPLITQLIDRMRGCTLFTKFDIRWGYNNIHIKDGDQWKAAFLTHEGLFEPMVMYFGLTNSPATFQTMMDTIFADEIAQGWLTVYMDDMGIHTLRQPHETEEQHIQRHRSYVLRILKILQTHDLYLEPAKCTFEQPEMDYLGIVIKHGEIHMEQVKVDKVKTWKSPTTVREVRKFLGFTGYYRYFIQNYSSIARPLHQLTHKGVKWHWETEHQRAFEQLRDIMCTKPVLRQPNYDKTFFVHTDASSYGAGAVLMQEHENGDKKPRQHPLAYYSATFTPTE